MRQVGPIALCLVRNGATVYRFDSLDHVGLSDGEIVDFSVSATFESWRAAVECAREIEGRRRVRLVALSLSAVSAFRLAAQDQDVESILAVGGVVNGVRTLERVLGVDYSAWTLPDLPHRYELGGYEIDPRPLWLDHHQTGCMGFDHIVGDLSRVRAAVANYVATEDPWVDIEDCRSAFARAASGERLIVELPYTGHDLGRNPIAINTVLTELTRMAVTDGQLAAAAQREVVMPGFDEVLELRIAERAREKSERAALLDERTVAT